MSYNLPDMGLFFPSLAFFHEGKGFNGRSLDVLLYYSMVSSLLGI
jgi:hypothetical protein